MGRRTLTITSYGAWSVINYLIENQILKGASNQKLVCLDQSTVSYESLIFSLKNFVLSILPQAICICFVLCIWEGTFSFFTNGQKCKWVTPKYKTVLSINLGVLRLNKLRVIQKLNVYRDQSLNCIWNVVTEIEHFFLWGILFLWWLFDQLCYWNC